MDSRGRFNNTYLARTSTFNMILTANYTDEGFVNLYNPSIILDGNRKWEIAIVDAFIPSPKAQSAIEEDYWFQYSIGLNAKDDERFLERYYYNPAKLGTVFESLAEKLNKVQQSPDLLGEYTSTRIKPAIRLFLNDEGYGCVEVLQAMVEGEFAIFKIPEPQYVDFFGGTGAFNAYLNGELINNLPGFPPYCYYHTYFDELRIGYYRYRGFEDDALQAVALKGGIFVSKEKAKPHPRKTPSIQLMDVECNIIKTNKVGGTKEGMRILGTIYPDIPEKKILTYVPLEVLSFDTIRIKLLDSFTKVPLSVSKDNLLEKYYIVINIRPV